MHVDLGLSMYVSKVYNYVCYYFLIQKTVYYYYCHYTVFMQCAKSFAWLMYYGTTW